MKKNYIPNRVIILHITGIEIPSLAEHLLYIKDLIHKITIRLKDIHQLDEQDIQIYNAQLDRLADIILTKKASGTGKKFDITNLNVLSSKSNHLSRCPAGSKFVVIGLGLVELACICVPKTKNRVVGRQARFCSSTLKCFSFARVVK